MEFIIIFPSYRTYSYGKTPQGRLSDIELSIIHIQLPVATTDICNFLSDKSLTSTYFITKIECDKETQEL